MELRFYAREEGHALYDYQMSHGKIDDHPVLVVVAKAYAKKSFGRMSGEKFLHFEKDYKTPLEIYI